MYLARMEAEDKFPWFNIEKGLFANVETGITTFIKKIKGIGLDVDEYLHTNTENLICNLFIFLAIFKF